MNHYRTNGVGEAAVEAFRERGNHYRQLVPTVTRGVPRRARGRHGDDRRARWRVLTVLGHAPEHACLYCEEAGVLISGDQVLPKITTNVSVWPDQPHANPLRLYLDSLGRFRPLPEEHARAALARPALPAAPRPPRLPAHHHEERLADTMAAVAEPRTASELVPVLFRRKLDTHQLGFAIGETLAHLHYLEAEGLAERIVDPAGVHRFRKA